MRLHDIHQTPYAARGVPNACVSIGAVVAAVLRARARRQPLVPVVESFGFDVIGYNTVLIHRAGERWVRRNQDAFIHRGEL